MSKCVNSNNLRNNRKITVTFDRRRVRKPVRPTKAPSEKKGRKIGKHRTIGDII